MRKMKDSGIEWIGEIPEDWEVCKLKNISDIYTGNSIKDNEKGLYSDMNNAYPYIATKDIDLNTSSANYKNGMYTKKDDINFKIAPKNSSLLCIEGGSAGKKITYLTEPVSFVNKLCCFTPRRINSKYQFYYLQSPSFISEFNLNMSGLIGGVSMGKLKEFPIINPPLEEQELISDYLDKKVQEIDNIISKTQETIEEYKKYKQSVITEAVTKGLNPNVEMKDSGIEWIGEIPKEWDIVSIKNVISDIKDGTHGSYNRVDFGKPLLSAKNITEDGIIMSNNESQISESDYFNIVSNGYPKQNDILMCCVGTVGRACIYEYNYPIAFQRSVAFLRCNNLIYNKFLLYYLRSKPCEIDVNLLINKSAQSGIYMNNIKKINIVLPPLQKQQQIINYIDKKCTEIDNLIIKKQELVTQLETYKKSLIYECVTGKKEVALAYAY